jgi:hypothetical protein
VDFFIGRHLPELIEVNSTPQEERCLQVARIFFDEWENRRSKMKMVRVAPPGEIARHGMSRNLKQRTRITCVSTVAACPIPDIVIFQAIESIRLQLQERSLGLGRNLRLKDPQKPHLNREFFANYIETVFLPYLADLLRN